MSPQKKLRDRLSKNEILLAPGVYDAFGAMMGERAGFDALYLSGASIAYTRLGRPDIGLVTAEELTSVVGTIRERSSLPLIVDADTGFGNALNVQRTVKMLERNGASAIQLEDQSLPKRCGHLAGKTLVSAEEMNGKIKAALDARTDDDTVIIARTDAIAVEGYDKALERAQGYVEAGADVLFIEAFQDESQITTAIERFGGSIPQLVNMVEGGKTPLKPASELEEMGFSIVIYPGALVRVLAHAADQYFAHLKEHGTTKDYQQNMFDFDALNDLLGTAQMLEIGDKYKDGGD
ncbi:MAG: carboxyvinyl-carboxyphosphonate phosphorylmutase [Rhodospirillaceae bacterium]|jgi:2-methylisocitrate lyase-like PEP mutase family enzyme|nr:carboxyvinyl-carboxyphosphonate phosphorylmutase [Rhodospirillaceae bacterium]MBT4589416.1 carboxyvinyl-carboxyphosphonate phosphorylmutase [Rhodospirillaceae bacterium]